MVRPIKATAAPVERPVIGIVTVKKTSREKTSAGIVRIGIAQSNTLKGDFRLGGFTGGA